MLDRFLAARPGLDREAFLHDYRALAASNAARILGRVFARQALLGPAAVRAVHAAHLALLERNLVDPALAGLKAWFDRQVPAGARA
jgi:aminoglycoside/choline kinase family phosphotransferase